MKKILIILLIVAFAAGVYVNFGMNKSTEDTGSVSSETAESNIPSESNTPEETEETTEESTTEPAEPEMEEVLSFNQEALDTAYTAAIDDDEPLIIDVVIPSYYSDSFISALSERFDSDQITFNRVDLESTTPGLETISVNANSDAVILDALQISDYNAEVLPERDADRLMNAYMNLYNSDKIVYILGNPNVHDDDFLADVLEEENDYLTSNDYYYIDNQNVSVEGDAYDYDTDEMTSASEIEIVQNIYTFMIE
ncbi:hypothetical protein ACFOU0_05160 [Salinicoccus sesuvii]|uniref:Uncharacterized protein n=1 Tax=Salinicoccus sesuvii TaxID=868281 RepID=A0ABV7N325_9STAP